MIEKDTILYVLTKSQEFLKSKGISNPRLDAELILADQLNLQRIKLYSNFDRILSEQEKNIYRDSIKSRGNFKPVAYIIGKKNFYESEFIVNQEVLIPRPETEELVSWILSEHSISKDKTVLDMGTGSGCIAITLQLQRPSWNILGVDISMGALGVAKQNSMRLLGEDTTLLFKQSDWFSEITERKFDIIVSNPPYIPIEEKSSIMPDVLDYEPHHALFIQDPEFFYPQFLRNSLRYLAEDGKIYLETHHDWAEKIKEIGLEIGFQIEIKIDYSNKNRMVKLYR